MCHLLGCWSVLSEAVAIILTKQPKTAIQPTQDALHCMTDWILVNPAALKSASQCPLSAAQKSLASTSFLTFCCDALWYSSSRMPISWSIRIKSFPLYLCHLQIPRGKISVRSTDFLLESTFTPILSRRNSNVLFPTIYVFFQHFPTSSNISWHFMLFLIFFSKHQISVLLGRILKKKRELVYQSFYLIMPYTLLWFYYIWKPSTEQDGTYHVLNTHIF